MSEPNISQILIRLAEQGSSYCPMCRHGSKHVVNIECLERFWRPLFPRKLGPEFLIRGCFYFHGAPLMYLYELHEFGYAVAAVHYAFAMILVMGKTELFWYFLIKFIETDQSIRNGDIKRKLALALHVMETLAWRSTNGELFPMPLICWYLPMTLFGDRKELASVMYEITVEEYKSAMAS